MTTQLEGRPATAAQQKPRSPEKSVKLGGLVVKIVLLGLTTAIAIWAAFPLIDDHAWTGLAILAAATVALLYLYLTPRHIPAKYLAPGTLFLIVFQLFPVAYTVSTAFTNFGDGHRGTKTEAVQAIQSASVTQVPGSQTYALTIATTRNGALVFLLAGDGKVEAGTAKGLTELKGASVNSAGRVTAADGYTILPIGEAAQHSGEITALAVPTATGAIRSEGLSRAYEGKAGRIYEAGCDCVRDTTTGKTWKADPRQGDFVAADGDRLTQGWKVDVGFRNFSRVLTDPAVSGPFLRTLVWNFAFALGSTGGTFMLGMICAIALHSPRVRGRRWYRILLVLPYAMPSFAMLLVWRDMFNSDFGLINHLFGVHVDWFGGSTTARIAVLLVQLWLGYPYMFLVTTGALQAIPAELTDASRVDGANPLQAFRSVTMPLLMVALTPLLISSFAFNFNNFNAVYLTTEGGPFPANDPSAGATDLLITYTYRLAFGGAGAQYGFATAVSVFIFLIVAVVSAAGFRRTRRQEEVYN